MRAAAFVRAHIVRIVCTAGLLLAIAFLLPLAGLSEDLTLLMLLIAALLEAIALVYEWMQRRAYLMGLSRIAEGEDDILAAATNLPEPDYPEGELSWNALQNVTRAARQEAAKTDAAMQAYRDYIETWVHEVKTPLAAARLMIANDASGSLAPFARELDRIDASVEQALFYARSSSLEQDYLIRSCTASALAKAAVKSRARALIEAHMQIDMAGLEGEAGALEIFCDPKWMDFILGQIVDNAIRYRAVPERDRREPKLSFSACRLGEGTASEQVVLRIADNGCGISAADLPRIFERGFSGTNGRTHEHSTGMGLYLVHSLCRKMGLSVSVASEEGAGTAISIAFPRERSREELGQACLTKL